MAAFWPTATRMAGDDTILSRLFDSRKFNSRSGSSFGKFKSRLKLPTDVDAARATFPDPDGIVLGDIDGT
jgi:hypothetical protein